MRIDSVDFFYLAMPEVTIAADGSQDALLVRVEGGGYVGWGECEAAPLPSIAAFYCPMSHGACRPVSASVLGQTIDGPGDIARIARTIARDSMDLLQAAHTWSGVEMALWDLLGRARGEPVWSLLGYSSSEPKLPYASLLFGDDPEVTRERAQNARRDGFSAAKFGWGPIGTGSAAADSDQFHAAREGLGDDAYLMVDTGQIFGDDVDAAAARLPALEEVAATWLEEPFFGDAYEAYAALAAQCRTVRIAGGEAAHNVAMARHMLDFAKVGYIQIDTGRIGGIGPAFEVAELARARDVRFVNHTFTTHLALSASMQPFCGMAEETICEFPADPSALARAFTQTPLMRDGNGRVRAPDRPGLGIEIDTAALAKYQLETELKVGGKLIYRTPALG